MMSGSAPDARAVSMFGIAQVIGIAGAALSVTLIVLLIRALLKYLRFDGRRSPPEQSRNLGETIKNRRAAAGYTQEYVAETLGVSRQTISKWETDETLPDIRQSKRLALLYGGSLDELIDFDLDVREVEQAIERTTPALEEKIDWTKAWGKKYPILLTYTRDVNVENYAVRLEAMIGELRAEYGYSELDAFLVLKDILASVWKGRKKKS